MTLKALKTPIKHSPKTISHSPSPRKTPIKSWEPSKTTESLVQWTNLDQERLIWNIFILVVTFLLFVTKGHRL